MSSNLAEINSKILSSESAALPAVTLKDGTKVQTGTVATMLVNIKLYNEGQRGGVEEELLASVPTLVKVGLFELFNVDEWIAGDNAGRTFVGRAAKELL
ncbi:hypothetical protein BC830DRAFT_1094060 [Chytriomyces sp. MP71]|nr:hypothetical protein BC830DRAFT_1094060 [Chytriomyces sp. MP71]